MGTARRPRRHGWKELICCWAWSADCEIAVRQTVFSRTAPGLSPVFEHRALPATGCTDISCRYTPAMQSSATTVSEYLEALPLDRRETVEAIREVILANIDPAFEEGIQYKMIGYYVPHSIYPDGYHCDPKQPLPFASIASQKNHIGIYLFCIYGNKGEEEKFRKEWLATGKKLDMGKACVRIKRLDDVPLAVIGRAFRRLTAKKFVAFYENAREEQAAGKKRKPTAKKAAAKKTATKKGDTTRKPTAKKAAKKKTVAKKIAKKKTVAKKVAKKAAKKKPAAKRRPRG